MMRKRVVLSGKAFAITLAEAAFMAYIAFGVCPRLGRPEAAVFLSAVIIVLLMALFYAPMRLTLDDKELCICRSLWFKRIPLQEITEVRAVNENLSPKRICGGGGFIGYWGWFRVPYIGKCFAYYGNPSQRFLLRLKNNRYYMLGCRDAEEMAAAIKERLPR